MAELRAADKQLSVTDEEIQQYVESEAARRASSPEAGTGMWTMEEELLGPTAPQRHAWGPFFRTLVHVMMLVLFAAFVWKELTRLLRTLQMRSKSGKEAADFDGSYYI